jgi:hypothetical protein
MPTQRQVHRGQVSEVVALDRANGDATATHVAAGPPVSNGQGVLPTRLWIACQRRLCVTDCAQGKVGNGAVLVRTPRLADCHAFRAR